MTTTKKIIKHLLILLSLFILLFSLYVSLTNRQVILVPEKAPVCNNSHLHFIYKPNQTESICFEPEIGYDGLFFSFFLDMDKSITYQRLRHILLNMDMVTIKLFSFYIIVCSLILASCYVKKQSK